MKLTITEIVANLRALHWDEMIKYLNHDFLPRELKELENNAIVKEEEIRSLIECLELIQTAMANQDVILLCDLLEYELQSLIKR